VAEDDAYVSYLEGCTAPSFDENQLHAAVVELSAGANAEIKYSTVQNWCLFQSLTDYGQMQGSRSHVQAVCSSSWQDLAGLAVSVYHVF
jgi:Fe-S cluster assembly scaffold protein SufB